MNPTRQSFSLAHNCCSEHRLDENGTRIRVATLALIASLIFLVTVPLHAQEPLKKITGNNHIEVNGDQEEFGKALKASNDFNVDGYDDLLIGAPLHDYPSVGTDTYINAGAAYIYYGTQDGWSFNEFRLTFPKSSGTFELFGSAVAFVRSYDDGNTADAIVTAPGLPE